MSDSPDDERLEELRKQKMQEMQEQGEQQEAQEAAQQQADAQKQAMLRQYLTDGARKRLNSVRMSKPDFAEKVEQQVLAVAQSGRVNGKIDEEKMKELLRELKPDSKSFNIRRR
ncbi:DNA-binding protein [Halorussus halophilus]|uniref:DNA-binding protein n=1 Tax=Halorussus halophilus TaxID=2650975 RepID=UPI00130182A8|nr:DNA-binding protein [Halorussus halophilus]